MDIIILPITLILTLIVFGLDISQKRRQYLSEQGS